MWLHCFAFNTYYSSMSNFKWILLFSLMYSKFFNSKHISVTYSWQLIWSYFIIWNIFNVTEIFIFKFTNICKNAIVFRTSNHWPFSFYLLCGTEDYWISCPFFPKEKSGHQSKFQFWRPFFRTTSWKNRDIWENAFKKSGQ